ncbi:MAG: protein kinase [Ktedonobacteraceae bacterium]
MTDYTGQQLGNYRLIRMLGRGGFADVYLGEHMYLKTQAAIKILQTQLTTAGAIEDFLKEGQTIARLSHTHIVRVLDFGVERNMPFLVMEYASHGTLRQRHADRRPLPVSLVISYTNQIAVALQYAHDQRLIHRDIKPENMLLGATDNVLLSDFGISTIAHTSHSLSMQDISGTVSYMAPEQLQGKASPASDQYALAVMVYEWLTGKCPFSGTFAEVASKHMFASPQSLRELVPNIHPDIEEVVRIGLAKTPEKRFARVEVFARALETASFGGTATFLSPLSQQNIQPPPQYPPSVLASSLPDVSVPRQSTPIPGGIVVPWTATFQDTPIPVRIPGPLPTQQSHSRRNILWGLAGAVALAGAAGVGVSAFLFSQMHPQIGTTSNQAILDPTGVTPATTVAIPTATPEQPSVQPSLTPEQQAQSVIERYYAAINNKDYQTAYALWPNYPDTYQAFANGFANTSHDDYQIGSISLQNDGTVQVNITIIATSTSAQQTTYQGYYIVGLQPDNSWKIVGTNVQKI